jgi:hypothetical protein
VENPLGNPIDGTRYDGGPEEGIADLTPAQPKVTQQQAFPGLAGQADGAQADQSSSGSGTKDFSLNGATGDYSTEPGLRRAAAPTVAPTRSSSSAPEPGTDASRAVPLTTRPTSREGGSRLPRDTPTPAQESAVETIADKTEASDSTPAPPHDDTTTEVLIDSRRPPCPSRSALRGCAREGCLEVARQGAEHCPLHE